MNNLDYYPFKDQDLEDKLLATNEWLKLTGLQRKIALIYFAEKDITKKELAKRAECAEETIHSFFRTQLFKNLVRIMARIEIVELIKLATKVMKECLTSKSDAIRFKAADRLLTSEGIIRDEPLVEKPKDIAFSWKGKKELNDRTSNTLYPPPQTEASP